MKRKLRALTQNLTRELLRRWSDDRLRSFVRSVEAGNTNGEFGWHVEDIEGWPMAEHLPLILVVEEVERRGWPPLRVTAAPPQLA